MNKHEKEIFQALTHNPYLSQQELANMVGLSRSTVANILSDLNNKGYIIGKPYVLNTKKIITCIGAANVDYKMQVEGKVIQETSNPVKKSTSLGGVVRNVAENLARLGEEVSIMTRVGNDTEGDKLIEDCSQLMHIFAIDKVNTSATGSYTAVLDGDKKLSVGLSDMEICDDMKRDWIFRHKSHISISHILVCDLNVQKDGIEALIEISKDKKIILVAVSVSKMLNMPENVNNIDLLILNIDETLAYLSCKQTDEFVLCQKLKEKGLKSAIITLGEKGCICYDELTKPTLVPAITPAKILDVTGAGDSFTAGVVYAINQDKSIIDACKYGATIASYTLETEDSVRKDISNKIFSNLK